MTMSSAKKKQTISDQINEILKPKELVEETDENEARFEEFTENSDVVNQLSDIRRQTAKHLSELDSKYKGKVVSRKDFEQDEELSNESSDNDAEGSENENNYATDSEESEENSDDDQQDGSDEQEENSAQSSDENESDGEFEDDFDLSQFAKPQPGSSLSASTQEKTDFLKDSSLSDEIKKGVAVQNQLKIWEKLLEVRIKSQKMLITANSLPDFDAHLELSTMDDSMFADKVEKTCDGVYGLLDNLLELQRTLVERFPESKDVLANTKRKNVENNSSGVLKRSKLAKYSDQIEDNYIAFTGYRNQVLQKWHDRTKGIKDTKNPAANLNIMTKIENALLGKNETIRKTQIYRGDYEIYGIEKPQLEETIDGNPTELELPEIFDDSEFYHQLLRELIEYKSNVDENQAEITQKFIELQKVRSRMKKKVDTRASKGRKIRYVVHNKLVNFMPQQDPSDYTEEAKTELYNSLFGMANYA